MKKTRLALIAAALLACAAYHGAALAQSGTAEQQQACESDAFRLCGQFIPQVDKITACMIKNYSKLSPACKTQFHK